MALPQGMNFFEWLFQLGFSLEGDPNYYANGEATEAEFDNLFSIATTEIRGLDDSNPVKEQYFQFLEQQGAFEGDPTYYSSGQAAEGEFTNFNQAVSSFFTTNEGGGEAEAPTGVMPGGETIRVGDQWYQAYEFPAGSGEFMVFQYNDRAMVEATFGDIPPHSTRSQTWLDNNAIVQADAEEVIGETVAFQRFTTELMVDAAAAAGIRDPSLVGRIASNPEMQQILAQAIKGDWTPEQVLAEQRQTSFWQDVLYPGIENFYDRTSDPEQAWARYREEVTPLLTELGYEKDASGTYNSQVEQMLELGIDSQVFDRMAPVFVQAEQNAEFAGALNQWAELELGRNIEFGDWFDLLAGESQPELEQVAENATLAWQAQNAGVGVSEDQIRQLAGRTDLSVAEAAATFSDFQRAVLATDSFRRSSLTKDDVLSAFAGVDPDSDFNVEQVKQEVAKLAREEDLFDEEKINFFVGFTPQGTPQRPGLQSLAPESA